MDSILDLIEFPAVPYMLIGSGICAVLVSLAVFLMPKSFRVGDAMSWMVLFLISPLPFLVGYPFAALTQLPLDGALPTVGVTIALGVAFVHWVFPAVVPDFNGENFTSSCVVAIMMGLAVVGAQAVHPQFEKGLGIGTEEAIFEGRSAGGLDNSAGEWEK